MKILFCFASLLALVFTKEDLSGLDQYLQDPSFWQFVEKRLGSRNDVEPKAPVLVDKSPSKVKDHEPSKDHTDGDTSVAKNDQTLEHQNDLMEDTLGNFCQYRPNASLIIRSKASINNGAFFLKSFNRRTREACVNACCYTQGCNLVVYENKDEHSCYFFNCGSPSKCLFTEHANYTSLFFPDHIAPSTSINGHQEQHENELEGLNSRVTPKPTTQAPRRKVPLYRKCDIDWNDECSDRNAECRDGECKCSYGYHAKYGICRANCPDSDFECENKGQRINVPECISKEHVCDGLTQCADGSDEDKCPNKDNDRNWFVNKPNLDDDDDDKNIPIGNKQKPTPKAPPKLTPRPTQKIKTTQAPDLTEIKHKDLDHISQGKTKPGESNSAHTSDKKPQVSNTKTEKIQTTKKNSTDSKVPDSGGLLEEAVQTHVVVESPTDSHQGPIVALALGLGITVILLFFVGCRLRNVKRRIRKGRALHSNEADYLINGMYL